MLDKITIDILDVCQCVRREEAPGWHGKPDNLEIARGALEGYHIVAEAQCFLMEQLTHEAGGLGVSIDEHLTSQLASGLALEKNKEPFLVWYSNVQNMCFLWQSSRKETSMPILRCNSRCDYSSQDIVHGNAEPFMYFDGNELSRVCYLNSAVRDLRHLTFDLGMFSACRLLQDDEDNQERIKSDHEQGSSLDYSIFSDNPVWRVRCGSKYLDVIRHLCLLDVNGSIIGGAPDEPSS